MKSPLLFLPRLLTRGYRQTHPKTLISRKLMVQPYAKNLLSRYTTKTTVLKTKMTLTLRRFVSCFLFKFLWRGSHLYFAASGQAVVKGVVPFSPPVLALNFVTQSFQQSHCASIFHRVLLTHFLALSLSQLVHNKTSLRIYTRMHSGGLELTKLTYTGSKII